MATIAAWHGRESELRILETLWQNHVQRVGTLRVLVIDRAAYIDGPVASYCQKKDVTELARCAAASCRVVNRLRVVPALSSGDKIEAQERGRPLAYGQPQDLTMKAEGHPSAALAMHAL